MKKRLLSLALCLALCLTLLSAAVLAAEEELIELAFPPLVSDVTIRSEGGSAWVELKLLTPSEVQNIINTLRSFGRATRYGGFAVQLSIDGGDWQKTEISAAESYDDWNGVYRTANIPGLRADSKVEVRARYYGENNDGKAVYSEWSETVSAGGAGTAEFITFTASGWALEYVENAMKLGLVPDGLLKADLTQPITRQEFAAVSVRVYESLSSSAGGAAASNPFTDTADADVLKAVTIGVTNGTSATTFAPEELLNREQASTMLSRAYKRLHMDGWSLDTDKFFAEEFHSLFTKPAAFADDGDISDWAMDSVYFMAANGILTGYPDGSFLPQAYATREQALVIALRMVQNLK